tara:strand:+ start:2162 stop:3277 length:1116 start_codon:yes stop_codon:yes gene_type:complete
MILEVTALLVSFLCFGIALLSIFYFKKNDTINIYFIAVLVIIGLQRFDIAAFKLGFTSKTYSPVHLYSNYFLLVFAFYSNFLVRLVQVKINKYLTIISFALPVVYVILVNQFFPDFRWNKIVVSLTLLVYYIFPLIELIKYLKITKARLKNLNTTQKWVLLVYLITGIMSVQGLNFFWFTPGNEAIFVKNSILYSSVIWLVLLCYLLINPIILFGEKNLLKILVKNNVQPIKIWSSSLITRVDSKDMKVYRTILSSINENLYLIKTLESNDEVLSKYVLDVAQISKLTSIPKYHIKFLFKYYCFFSVNEYSNTIRILFAVKLIKKGYLEFKTIAALAQKCHFESRITFFNNFKKVMNLSPTEYIKTLKLTR